MLDKVFFALLLLCNLINPHGPGNNCVDVLRPGKAPQAVAIRQQDDGSLHMFVEKGSDSSALATARRVDPDHFVYKVRLQDGTRFTLDLAKMFPIDDNLISRVPVKTIATREGKLVLRRTPGLLYVSLASRPQETFLVRAVMHMDWGR